ncbi:DNA primase small subunit [Diachasma alloeum]|uniref:DNA primase small subunit n=1 Tax=Diachasma alloeum TaxID=454923 RepID=UPI0007383DE3|nr:DNA primase small subunit [Diachasma alloeum]
MGNLGDLLPVYYSRLFPFNDYYRWLSYGKGENFHNREFSFTLGEDVYIRYQAFTNLKQFENEIKRILPFKIDIGAIYSVCPRQERRVVNLVPVQRELVFDIDMTDYDEVRTCCSGADICNKCWKYMDIACKILDTALKEDFGFNHILWVFSGRRGIHAWVCDPIARTLDTAARGAVAEYLQLISGGEYTKKKVNLPGDRIHPSVKRALDIITPRFVSMCVEEQDMLGSVERVQKFLGILPDDSVKADVKELFDKYEKGVDRWEVFENYVKEQVQSNKKWRQHRHLIEEIMIQYCYPRLDINVTKGMNHLLKSPFCVHPKTGKVCIPFNPRTVERFDPLTVPTINALIDEINAYDEKDKTVEGGLENARKIKDYKKTSMNKSLHLFQEFLRAMEDARKLDREAQMSTMEF